MASRSFEDSVTGAIVTGTLIRDLREDGTGRDGEEEESHRRARALTTAERALAEHADEARVLAAELEESDQWHAMEAGEALRRLGSSLEDGLSETDAQRRLHDTGPNRLESSGRAPLWLIFLQQFLALPVVMLLGAAAASLALGEWVEGVAVFVILVLNAIIATYTEGMAGNALDALSRLSNPTACVVRGGVQRAVPTFDLVPGDVVVLSTGDVVPADARVCQASGLKVNEMLLTGESEPCSKHHRPEAEHATLTAGNMVFSGSTVVGGGGWAVVVATGMSTRVGAIASMLRNDGRDVKQKRSCCARCSLRRWSPPKRTPLQRQLHRLGLGISVAAISACIVVFFVGLARDYEDPLHADNPAWLQLLMVSVALAVSAIPEGLPLAVTICLALGTTKMLKHKALIRRLPAVETLGSAQVVCTDKTGTLTEGRMRAVQLWQGGGLWSIGGSLFVPAGPMTPLGGEGEPQGAPLLTPFAMLLCSDAQLVARLSRSDAQRLSGESAAHAREHGRPAGADQSQVEVSGDVPPPAGFITSEGIVWEPRGNATEAPLVVAAAKLGLWRQPVCAALPRAACLPFNSARKLMLTVHRVGGEASEPAAPLLAAQQQLLQLVGHRGSAAGALAVVKGAPNQLIERCTHMLAADGSSQPLQAEAVLAAVDSMSGGALRVLAVAVRAVPPSARGAADGAEERKDGEQEWEAEGEEGERALEELAQELTLVGLVGLMDPEKEGVRESVALARQAGVRTVMITGDYVRTAVAIARNVGILTVGADASEMAVDSAVLRKKDGAYKDSVDIDDITDHVNVFARATPEDKIVIVESLRRLGFVTSMTGDGVNDAPALQGADIGVAMGVAGTEVAKGASDMVLLDDNFSSIVTAIANGRVLYNNIQKFVTYFLGTNLTQVIVIFTCIVSGLPSPLQPLSILVLNLAVDGMPAMAMSVEPSDGTEMSRPPRPRTQPVVTARVMQKVLGHAVVVSILFLLTFSVGLYTETGRVSSDALFEQAGANSTVACDQLNWDSMSWAEVHDNDCRVDGLRRARAFAYAQLALSEVARALTVRSPRPLWHATFANRALLFAMTLSSALMLIMVLLPAVQGLFDFADLSASHWSLVIVMVIVSVASDEYLKMKHRSSDELDAQWSRLETHMHGMLVEVQNLRRHVETLQEQPRP